MHTHTHMHIRTQACTHMHIHSHAPAGCVFFLFVGIFWLIRNDGAIIRNNVVHHCQGVGIFYEISSNAQIYNNKVRSIAACESIQYVYVFGCVFCVCLSVLVCNKAYVVCGVFVCGYAY